MAGDVQAVIAANVAGESKHEHTSVRQRVRVVQRHGETRVEEEEIHE